MLSLRQIEVFRAVMRAGTVVAAAGTLKVTQPTVTKTLRRVEDVLGVALFERGAGRIVPTAEALRVLAEIENAFAELETALGRVTGLARQAETTLRIGASPSLGRSLVPDVMAGIAKVNPGVSLHLDILSVSQLLDYVLAGACDAAFGLFSITHGKVRSTRIGFGRMVALAPIGHRIAASARIEAAGLADEQLIVFEPQTVHGQAIAALFSKVGGARYTHLVRFAESAVALAEAAAGIALVDEFSAMAADRSRVSVLPVLGSVRFEVYCHVLKERPVTRFGQLFRDEIERRLRILASDQSRDVADNGIGL